MRSCIVGLLGFSILNSVAWADDLVAIKPGLICVSPEALARLTLPDGSSRTAQTGASPADLALKNRGGCVDITPGMRVSVTTTKHNTSIALYSQPGRPPKKYIIPNIDFAPVPFEPSATATDGASGVKIEQVVRDASGTTYSILTLPSKDAQGDPEMEIEATYPNGPSSTLLLKSWPASEPADNLTGFSNLFLSPDSKTLYFQTEAWATSNAVHSIDLKTGKVSYVGPGGIACVVLSGDYRGDLIVQQHRYFVQGGSYDNFWLLDPSGKELGLVSEDADASKVCPNLSD